eukprot:CAMPEP_0178609520 /NCGR_PEP_ID=MMETSP0697-20121206/38690_1 /TAXON_ID=265572 /ORGANISM="Extubocellulus spinifer, Strain CCMP396" /LENGTH=69 /DNA_ID=CAMNT_0020248101 /DNA_START=430 /DNA_END=636 /DNA_ORIENTATION=+
MILQPLMGEFGISANAESTMGASSSRVAPDRPLTIGFDEGEHVGADGSSCAGHRDMSESPTSATCGGAS